MHNPHKSVFKFYVYVLFDAFAIPRYVGKGKGNRWIQHDQGNDPTNHLKNKFIKETLAALGEIPKVKIRENLTEKQAFKIEKTLIKAIGRYPNGPLVNLTDNRNGPSSDRIKQWHASRSTEEKKASARKTVETRKLNSTPEERSERARKSALSQGADALSQRMKEWQASRTPEQRSEDGKKGGLASNAATSYEQKRANGYKAIAAYMNQTTPEQRKENAKRTGLAKLTKEQLSENGKKGIAKANANRTPEQRKQLARKAALALHAKRRKLKRVKLDPKDPRLGCT